MDTTSPIDDQIAQMKKRLKALEKRKKVAASPPYIGDMPHSTETCFPTAKEAAAMQASEEARREICRIIHRLNYREAEQRWDLHHAHMLLWCPKKEVMSTSRGSYSTTLPVMWRIPDNADQVRLTRLLKVYYAPYAHKV